MAESIGSLLLFQTRRKEERKGRRDWRRVWKEEKRGP